MDEEVSEESECLRRFLRDDPGFCFFSSRDLDLFRECLSRDLDLFLSDRSLDRLRSLDFDLDRLLW